MTENERVDRIFARIERAKKLHAFKSMPEFALRIAMAERALGLAAINVAEQAMDSAERIHLVRELADMASFLINKDGGKTYREVMVLISRNKLDQAAELVLA